MTCSEWLHDIGFLHPNLLIKIWKKECYFATSLSVLSTVIICSIPSLWVLFCCFNFSCFFSDESVLVKLKCTMTAYWENNNIESRIRNCLFNRYTCNTFAKSTISSVHENHQTHWTFTMARPKRLMRNFTNLNRIYKAHQTNVWWIVKVFQVHCISIPSYFSTSFAQTHW